MSVDDDFGRASLLELFREETLTQTQALSERLLALDRGAQDAATLEACMRAAHSLKGAARIVGVPQGVDIAGRMEDCFVAAQHGRQPLTPCHVDALLTGVDLLVRVGDPQTAASVAAHEIDAFAAALAAAEAGPPGADPNANAGDGGAADRAGAAGSGGTGDAARDSGAGDASRADAACEDADVRAAANAGVDARDAEENGDTIVGARDADHSDDVAGAGEGADFGASAGVRGAISRAGAPRAASAPTQDAPTHDAAPPSSRAPDADRASSQMRRVRADTLNRLLGLSGESLVESRWLKPFAESMLRVKRAQRDAARSLDSAVEALADDADPRVRGALNEVRQMFTDLQRTFAARLDELDRFERRSSHIAEQLYDEALQCRMRPFGDATRAYPRVVRDLARSLGKRVRFSIVGEATQVDRDILDMLDAPLGHLLRNAIDHGVEPPDVRLARGKPAEASVTLEARHSAGSLLVSVSDDGPGADLAAVRAAIVRHNLTDEDTAARLSDAELLEFLLLPGFSMRERVTDVSGRGVGLDAVQEMVKSVRGAVRIFNEPGLGMRFVLQLPLTLSVIRSLIVDVGGEPYAFPLVQVRRTLELDRADIDVLEGQQHFPLDDRRVGLVTAHQLLDAGELDESRPKTAVVVVGGEPETYGVAVDRFLGERMLVVQPLDGRLNKIQNIAAGALLENGDPVLIVDVEDLIRSIDKLIRGGQLAKVRRGDQDALARRTKRVLVVDDSLTVRELERKLLEKRGYDVTIAIDGMDGWNAIRGDSFDLVVTDIDMPRMDGIELVTLIKGDPLLKSVPVMIVSYKDRDEDRRRGLEAGADYYLAKGGFHDEALLDAVHDLIGDA
ncbi:hybrid sensor histidine kinase/response regulator [Burkholderia thailandensis]|uniref:Chemotaxis protein CheA n=3 Tax=Burkholderia thailandensis TaxID=57975 RepID=A0AAW9CMP9_BURTH|nr:hybrid sensor histidine kinase/response regulator [Burkholderia thailandensis]AHI66515.1 cheW-like domain protein [Burkholderia thailandensis H0587]AOJ53127.1 hybrid sensor histidine kinase/response regulator [Burkholderia thailandensis]AVR28757.1 hybrid sensor histidine kinase/response regulator [Burkholderia thailandensis]MCS3392853.1 hybrid sensor histidine kinase/response regulator [Burkholderia thailandensis]MCS6425675.1 hybrid sensor histidine kinase/response regulator [Burkholderia t